jgi:hypothetical protein
MPAAAARAPQAAEMSRYLIVTTLGSRQTGISAVFVLTGMAR